MTFGAGNIWGSRIARRDRLARPGWLGRGGWEVAGQLHRAGPKGVTYECTWEASSPDDAPTYTCTPGDGPLTHRERQLRFGRPAATYRSVGNRSARLRPSAACPVASRLGSFRRGATSGSGGRCRRRAASPSRERNQAIRDWAKAEGLEVSDRGRISQDLVERYEAEVGK